MRWVCPHCRTALETPDPDHSKTAGPRPGWAYGRCTQCTEFSSIELATGAAEAIRRPQPAHAHAPIPTPAPAPVSKVPVPPPFNPPKAPATTPAIAPALIPTPAAEQPSAPWLQADPDHVIQAGPPRRLPRPSTGIALALTAAVLAGSAMMLKARSFARLAQTALPPAPVSAPVRPVAAAPVAAPAPIPVAAPVALVQAPAQLLSDSIRSDAGAPERPRPDDVQLYLQARRSARALELRTGPGANYPLLGLGDLDERYPVLEIRNKWFRIQLEDTPGLSAWVPYERIELFSKDKEPAKEISSD